MSRIALYTALAVLLAVARPVRAQVAEQDSLALVALYHATGGPLWELSTGWLKEPVPTWFGVNTSRGRVTSVSLTMNKLRGEIPAELGELEKLTFLNLQLNELTGEIPPALGNLPKLKALFLSMNKLTGGIPPELGRLDSLELLSLQLNELTGELPPSLGSLSNLAHLILDYNRLDGTVPAELANLTGLSNLQLDSNDFEGPLPPALTALADLASFDFSNTALCAPETPAFQDWLRGIGNLKTSGLACVDTAVDDPAVPGAFVLEANYPNPFNPGTQLPYVLPVASSVRLSVYDAQGRLVAVLVDGVQPAGRHEALFRAEGMPSGVYYYRLTTEQGTQTRRMLLVR